MNAAKNVFKQTPLDKVLFSFKAKGLDKMSPDDDHYMNKYTVKINGRQFKYFMGLGLKEPPKMQDVLNTIFLDSSALDESFKDWASNYGYDTDSRKAERIFKACKRNAQRLRVALGADYDAVKKEIESLEL